MGESARYRTACVCRLRPSRLYLRSGIASGGYGMSVSRSRVLLTAPSATAALRCST